MSFFLFPSLGYLENIVLHNWKKLNGTFGLSYCSSSDEKYLCDAFRLILANVSDSLSTFEHNLFGLDFNDMNSISEMHLGHVKDKFKSSMVWATQTSQVPSTHQFIMRDLRLGCGNSKYINIFGRYGSTWPAMIDTGSACLALPAEMYDDLRGWWDADFENINDIDDLPSLYPNL